MIILKIITVGFEGGYSCVDPPIIISPNSDGVNDNGFRLLM